MHKEMEFLAFEWMRMEFYKRDAYHVEKHSRPTPRLAHVIIYLFILVYIGFTSDSSNFAGVS